MLSIRLNQNKKYSIEDIIKMFINIGWNLYDEQGKITYLPLGDVDEFNWQSDLMNEEDFYMLIREKEKHNELIGLTLYWSNTMIGVDLLAQSSYDIMLSITVNRKLMYADSSISITDVNWYIDKTVINLKKAKYQVENFKFEELC